MQFIPETAKTVGEAVGIVEFSLDRLYDPAVSIQMGAHYWASLVGSLNNLEMALAAYNGGVGNVHRWRSKAAGIPEGDLELFVADIGFVETKRYVMDVFAARAAYGSLVN
jgi:soluble lytic murein transglycosylase